MNFHLFNPSPEMIKEAKNNPGGWVIQIQGNYSQEEHIPPKDIVGVWKVNEQGLLTKEFKPNPNFIYQPNIKIKNKSLISKTLSFFSKKNK
jgi:hypothetical protein